MPERRKCPVFPVDGENCLFLPGCAAQRFLPTPCHALLHLCCKARNMTEIENRIQTTEVSLFMKILVVNAGSSSLKYQLFDMDENKVIAKGNCEKIGIGGFVTHKRPGKDDYKADVELKDHDDAINLVLSLLTDAELGVIASVDEIDAIGKTRDTRFGEQKKEEV